MKAPIKGTWILLPAIAMTLQACGWGADGVDRMNELYPKDVVDAGEVAEGDTVDDVASQDAAETVEGDLVETDTMSDAVATDTTVWPDVSYEGIEGRWAVRLVSKGIMTVPIVGERPMATTDLFLAEGTGTGLSLTFCDELIAVEPTADFSNSTTTKEALRQAIAATPIELAVTGTSINAQQIVWKWALGEAIGDTDPLPEEVNLTNYPDIDSDTHEGCTIAVSLSLWGSPTVGERYMAKRAKFDLAEGAMSTDGRWITGSMTFTVDEKVLGADQGLLNNGAAIAPQTEGTVYQFRRVDDSFDCATLVADHESLFEQAP